MVQMRFSLRTIFLGWCLTSHKWMMTGGQAWPKPSISVTPSEVIPPGGNVTFHCKCKERYLPAEFILDKLVSASWHRVSSIKLVMDEAVFHIISAKPSDAGKYHCTYLKQQERYRTQQEWSPYSDEVHIKVKEVFYPKPLISVSPNEVVPLGASVTIQCNSTEYQQDEYYLLKEDGRETTQVKQKGREAAVFSISIIKLSDGGIYCCKYRNVSSVDDRYSPTSDRVYINITDPSLAKPLIQMQSKRQQYSLGGNATIRCEGPEKGLTFFLYKSRDLVASQTAKPGRNRTVFPILSVRPEDAGSYTCQYHGKGTPFVWSDPSIPMKLVVKDPSFAKPVIQMQPEGPYGLGVNVTIHCVGPQNGLTFFLYKSRDLVDSQIPEPGSNCTAFSIHSVRPEDAGKYTCQYHGKGNPFVCSEPSMPMLLAVKDRLFPTTLWAGVAAGCLLVLVLLLLCLFILYRKRRKSAPQEVEDGEGPDEVSYAVLNLNSLENKQAGNPHRGKAKTCVYAVVATKNTRKRP